MKRNERRVMQCKRCGNIIQVSKGMKIDSIEDRCPDPKAPGGYWYCDYVELTPKTPKEKQ